MEFNIDLKQFEGVEFDGNNMAAYVEFWAPYMTEMELTEEQKNELAKAWQILAIEYAKDVEKINKKHVNFDKMCWDVFAYIVKHVENEVDWNKAFDGLVRFYPPRPFAMLFASQERKGMLGGKNHGVEFIAKQVMRHLNRPEIPFLLKK